MPVVDSHARSSVEIADAGLGRQLPPEESTGTRLRIVGDVCCIISLAVAVAVLIGWSVGNQTLIRLVPGLVAMNRLTAVCFILASVALLLRGRVTSPGRGMSRSLAYSVVLCGCIQLVGSLGWRVPVDRWLVTAHFDVGAALPNRIPPITAINFCLSGSAILALSFSRYRVAQGLALAAGFTAVIALVGYTYSVASFGEIPAFIPMALNTSLLFVLLAVGVMAGAPEHGVLMAVTRRSAGGRVLRRLLPGLWLGPPLLGWLRLHGELAGLFTPAVGVALFAAATIVLGTSLAWLTARAVDRGEAVRRRAEEAMARLAHFDQLTGLPNRSLFDDRLHQALARAQRAQANLALMFLDLDGFKQVNDRLGHDVGDRVLQEAARRIQGAVRSIDTAARLGGDEFVIVLEQIRDRGDIEVVANRLVQSLSAPFEEVTTSTPLSVSVGVSLYPGDGKDAEHLLSSADAAMYSAKRAGKGRVAFYEERDDAAGDVELETLGID